MLLYTLLAGVLIFLMVNYQHNRVRLRRMNQKLDRLESLELSTNRDLAHWSALMQVIQPRAPLPQFSTATLDPESVVTIVSQILSTQPKEILLLGASPLAIICGYLAKVTCIEQNPLQASELREQAALHRVEVEVREHPLRIQEHGTPWYTGELPTHADLVIVDGPSPFAGKGTRLPALTHLKCDHMIFTAVDSDSTLEGLEIRGRIGLTSRHVEGKLVSK